MVGLLLAAGLLCGCGATTAAPGPGHGDVVRVGRVDGLGSVLVDAEGRTLYLYEPDRQGPSRCGTVCEFQWSPLLAPKRATGAQVRLGPGVDQALVATVARPGSDRRQVTYDRWPLYSFHLDTAAGQAQGESADMGLWYAVSPAGQPVIAAVGS